MENYKKKKYIYIYIYIYIYLNHFAVYLKLTQHCKLTMHFVHVSHLVVSLRPLGL